MDILYRDYTTFNVLGEELNIFSSETEYGRSTVVELNGEFYYLGDEPADLETALFAWQDMHNKTLTLEEFEEIINTNGDQNGNKENCGEETSR
jgi:hypothetical protein